MSGSKRLPAFKLPAAGGGLLSGAKAGVLASPVVSAARGAGGLLADVSDAIAAAVYKIGNVMYNAVHWPLVKLWYLFAHVGSALASMPSMASDTVGAWVRAFGNWTHAVFAMLGSTLQSASEVVSKHVESTRFAAPMSAATASAKAVANATLSVAMSRSASAFDATANFGCKALNATATFCSAIPQRGRDAIASMPFLRRSEPAIEEPSALPLLLGAFLFAALSLVLVLWLVRTSPHSANGSHDGNGARRLQKEGAGVAATKAVIKVFSSVTAKRPVTTSTYLQRGVRSS